MNEITMAGFLRAASSHYAAHEAEYLLFKMEGNAPGNELIISPRENFSDKIAYVQKAYDEELRLKNAPHIRIVNFAFLTKEELHYYL